MGSGEISADQCTVQCGVLTSHPGGRIVLQKPEISTSQKGSLARMQT